MEQDKCIGRKYTIENKVYEVIEKIDEGGNGIVYKAKSDGVIYAIKKLDRKITKSNEKKINRFKNEIDFCKNNRHENLITIYGEGEMDNKLCYVMPFYKNNLRNIIKEDIEIEMIFNYIFQLCRVLKYLHDNKIIHRDIKPENILIDNEKLILTDFGIAHFDDSSLTVEQEMLANRAYASPEQKIPGKSKEITTASDIYSLGLIINELFTKERPDGSNFKQISDKYPWLSELDTLIEKCINKNPDVRPSSSEILVEIASIKENIQNEYEDIEENL